MYSTKALSKLLAIIIVIVVIVVAIVAVNPTVYARLFETNPTVLCKNICSQK